MKIYSKLGIFAVSALFVLSLLLWVYFPLSFTMWIEIVLFILLFFVFSIAYIVYLVLRPLFLITRAMEEVGKGHYEKIVLPQIKDRKDEIALLIHGFDHMVQGLKERGKIRALLDKVVSKEIADEILKNPPLLGGEDRIVTMLFSDIRGFTNLTQDLSPQKTIEILNFYMTKMSRVIENEGGLIDKFVGDEIMALFGAPVNHPQHALRAISTGILMLQMIKKVNLERSARGEAIFEMGIAIHTGVVVAGNMGAEDRLNYTVLGRNVNLAARLCQSTEKGQLLISESSLQEPGVREAFKVKALEPLTLRGFSEPVTIYEVISFQWES